MEIQNTGSMRRFLVKIQARTWGGGGFWGKGSDIFKNHQFFYSIEITFKLFRVLSFFELLFVRYR